MEDSVGEEERREQGETVAQAKAHQEEERETAAAGGGDPAEEGGFLSAVASKIGTTMSGTNGSGGEANAAAASAGEEGKRDANGEPGEESGFLSAMASKIGAAMSGANGGSVDGGGNAAVASDGEDKKEDGDGGGGIFHKLLSSSQPAESPTSGAMETEEVKGEEKGQEAPGEKAGILSAMASRIGMAMSAANGNGNLSGDDAKVNNGEAFHGSNGEDNEEGDEANGGGILSAMASKIGMAMSGANGDDNHGGNGDNAKTSNGNAVDASKDEEKRNETNGGGILSSVASKIGMAVSGANGNGNNSTEDDAKTSNGDAVHGSKGEEKEKKGHDANGAGIVEQIISNLPSDDQAPDSDEASLLIAIIED